MFSLAAVVLFDRRLRLPRWLGRLTGAPGVALASLALVAQSAFLLFAGVGINSYARTEFPSTSGTRTLAALVGDNLVALDAGNVLVRSGPLGDGLYPEMNLGYGIDELAVHDPAAPTALFSSWPIAGAGQLESAGAIFTPSVDSVALAQRYGAGFILVAAGQQVPVGTTHVATIDGDDLVRVPDSARFVASGTTIMSVRHPSDTSYVLRLNASAHSTTVLAHITNSPGWSATANGKALDVSSRDGVAYVAHVPAHTSEVDFDYQPPHFVLSWLVALIALALLATDAFWLRRTRHRSDTA
jgi:hypothetical protein